MEKNLLKEVYFKEGNVLELGCGEELDEANRFKKSGYNIFCVDKKCCSFKNLIKGDFFKIPFPKRKFVLVYGRASFQYGLLSQILKLMKKVHKSLIEDGIVYGTVHSTKDELFNFYKENFKKTKERNTFRDDRSDQLVHFFDEKDVRYILKDFKISYIKDIKYYDKAHHGRKGHYHHAKAFLAKKI